MNKLITFETAKLLKEKDFYVAVPQWYTTDGELLHDWTCMDRFHKEAGVPAPDQAFLQMWLRTQRDKVVSVSAYFLNDIGLIFNTTVIEIFGKEAKYDPIVGEDYMAIDFTEYEDALEAGLQYALKLL
jgi:hypothetical protein